MTTFIDNLNHWSAQWVDAMSAVLWQSTLLALAVAAVCWALRHQSPRLRYWLWLIVAAKLLVMPFWSVDVGATNWLADAVLSERVPPGATELAVASPPRPASSESAAATPRESSTAEPPAAWRQTATWQTWLMLAWILVVIIEVVRTAWQFIGLRRLLAAARPVDDRVESIVADCARLIGAKHAPPAKQIEADSSPLVCGPLRPVLLLPASLTAAADSTALRQIVLHELAHVRRRDLLTTWVIHVARIAYWFHPVVHWVAYRAGLERELACDQLAMRHSGATAASYARTLIHAAGRTSHPIVLRAAGAAGFDGGEGPATPR